MRSYKLMFIVPVFLFGLLLLSLASSAGSVAAIGAPPKLLANGQFVYGPNVGAFSTAAFLKARESNLLRLAPLLDDIAVEYSINPRVLLSLIEIQWGWVTASPQNLDGSTFHDKLDAMARTLVHTFYARL